MLSSDFKQKLMAIIKRYAMAMLILFFVVLLMVLSTLGVKSFGDKMAEDSGITQMQPRGEKVKL